MTLFNGKFSNSTGINKQCDLLIIHFAESLFYTLKLTFVTVSEAQVDHPMGHKMSEAVASIE